jgi:hypothetical protein
MKTLSKLVCFAVAGGLALAAVSFAAPAEENPVTIIGGHDIDPKLDHGRPCVLIAAALGVKTEEFREAFSGVTPAKDGKPGEAEARRNKEALMKVLKPLGVTNDRLDEVSNYYRYRPQDGIWKHKDAEAVAVVEGGKLVKVTVKEAGSGYTNPPKVTVKGFEKVELVVTLHLDKDMTKNGSIEAIEIKK